MPHPLASLCERKDCERKIFPDMGDNKSKSRILGTFQQPCFKQRKINKSTELDKNILIITLSLITEKTADCQH